MLHLGFHLPRINPRGQGSVEGDGLDPLGDPPDGGPGVCHDQPVGRRLGGHQVRQAGVVKVIHGVYGLLVSGCVEIVE